MAKPIVVRVSVVDGGSEKSVVDLAEASELADDARCLYDAETFGRILINFAAFERCKMRRESILPQNVRRQQN